jgi:hypothetical protein
MSILSTPLVVASSLFTLVVIHASLTACPALDEWSLVGADCCAAKALPEAIPTPCASEPGRGGKGDDGNDAQMFHRDLLLCRKQDLAQGCRSNLATGK